MTDIEIIKKCADRMDYKVALDIHGTFFFVTDGTKQPERHDYNPLTDDAQAMALVRRFNICIDQGRFDHCCASIRQLNIIYSATSPDLNRAICECVARLP